MCGIAGIIYKDTDKCAGHFEIKKMTDILSHRGPDGEGYFVENNVALGHRRLSIIDLETGEQPIQSFDGRFVIIYNGEIYNYIELRDELRAHGYVFHTSSDTEVLLNAFHKWGEKCLGKLNGMWAFAIWDKKEKKLFASRDRIGEKPFFYAIQNDRFIFASEIKSLLAVSGDFKAKEELTDIYFTFSFIPAPYTFYENIYKLKPGHYLTFDCKDISIKKYWDLPDINENEMYRDKNKIYKEFEDLLYDSVKIRMRSDVPYGAFLSGGLDSSGIVYLMSEISDYPVETFTIGFEEKEFDESSLARIVSQRFKTNHHEQIISKIAIEDALNRISHHFDEPFGDPSAIPTGLVSGNARKKIKMALTGDGGDEVLSGYTTYQGEKITNIFSRFPKPVQKNAQIFSLFLSDKLEGNFKIKLNRVERVLRSSSLDFSSRLILKSMFIDPDDYLEIRKSGQMIKPAEILSELMSECRFSDNFYRLMYYNLKISLPDDMLCKVDRMSMANSLETRIPFLDHRIVELMVALDKNIKMEGFERKSILRNTIGKHLPRDILKAPKKGFEVPFQTWFKNKIDPDKVNIDFENLKIDKVKFEKMYNKNINHNRNYGNFLWLILILDHWYKKNKKIPV